VPVAVCSTSNEKAVSTIVRVLLGDDVAAKMPVYAGDIVPRKKPSPDIYLLAAKEMGLEPADCVVVEDSGIGVAAAKAAGMRCVGQGLYTRGSFLNSGQVGGLAILCSLNYVRTSHQRGRTGFE
jgi:beta-phosphoglucomutase-like phosphatase (HAD superfamily)